MTTELPQGFVLYVDGRATVRARTMVEAQKSAAEPIAQGRTVRIENLSGPAPSAAWTYDARAGRWVEERSR